MADVTRAMKVEIKTELTVHFASQKFLTVDGQLLLPLLLQLLCH